MSTPEPDLMEKIDRFKRFWAREETDRPTFGFGLTFPAKSLTAGLPYLERGGPLQPREIEPEDFLESYEALYRRWESVEQDALWTAVPWNGVPWVEAMMGCEIASSPSGFDALPRGAVPDAPSAFEVSPDNPWQSLYFRFIDLLSKLSAGRFPVGQPILRGVSDTLGAVLGQDNMIYALYDHPERVREIAGKIAAFLGRLLARTVERTPRFHGGTCMGFYNLWAPGPAAWFQDDLAVLFSPELYADYILPLLRPLAEVFPYTMTHWHPAAFQHLDALLDIPGLTALQINRDIADKSIRDMLPELKKIQRHKCLVIQGILTDEDLSCIAGELTPRGLHINLMSPSWEEVEQRRNYLARKFRW
jgi:hypothetical protein